MRDGSDYLCVLCTSLREILAAPLIMIRSAHQINVDHLQSNISSNNDIFTNKQYHPLLNIETNDRQQSTEIYK